MGDGARVGHCLGPAALVFRTRDTVLRPDLHRHTDDVVASLAQEIASDTRIDTTTHAEQYALLVHLNGQLPVKSSKRQPGAQAACLCFSAGSEQKLSSASCRRLHAGSLRSPQPTRDLAL